MDDTCFIIGGGPSVSKTNLKLLHKKFVIGVNTAFLFGSWIDIWFFGDSDIYKDYRFHINDWPNRIVSCASAAKRDKRIEYLQRCARHAICMEEGHISFYEKGANSGASAINLAIREGFNKIVLVGFDMRIVDGQHHYHNLYRTEPNEGAYARFMGHFKAISEETTAEIINATPDSALPFFPFRNLEDLV